MCLCFWVGSSSSNFQKTLKSANIFDEEDTDSPGDLLRPSLDDRGIRQGDTFRKRYSNFRFAKPGIHDKQRKVLPQTEEGDGVPRVYYKLRIDDHLSTLIELNKNNQNL